MLQELSRAHTVGPPTNGSSGSRIRWLWERLRPFQVPAYVPGVPTTYTGDPLDVYLPPTAQTFGAAASSREAAEGVLGVLERLTPGAAVEEKRVLYRYGLAKFGAHWRYADLLTALWAAGSLLRPASYLEIGMRRGHSAAVIGATCPACAIHGFDLWIENYGGLENPGPDFVRSELEAAGHAGPVTLVSGDSARTVPAFLRDYPDLYFDLVTVDGDHSVRGFATDLANTLPRLKVGGIVLSDDLSMFPILRRVWRRVIVRDGRFVSWEFSGGGFGVAAAIRISDGPPPRMLYGASLS